MKSTLNMDDATYLPRLKFALPQNVVLKNKEEEYKNFYVFKEKSQKDNSAYSQFIILGKNKKKKAEISSELVSFYNALRLAAMRCHTGISINKSNLGENVSYIHADSIMNVSFSKLESSIVVEKDFRHIAKNVDFFYNTHIKINNRQNAVIDMLTTAFYEQSVWAKFFICISSIEILIPKRHKKTKIGINKRCSDYIKNNLGEIYSNTFKKLYTIRCKFAHGNFNVALKDIPFEQAYDLAERILYYQLGIEYN